MIYHINSYASCTITLFHLHTHLLKGSPYSVGAVQNRHLVPRNSCVAFRVSSLVVGVGRVWRRRVPPLQFIQLIFTNGT